MPVPAPSSLVPARETRRPGLALAALVAVLSLAGCASSPAPSPGPSPSALVEPGGTGLAITPAQIAASLGDDTGLCIRTVGPVAACTPRPKVKRVLGELLQPALREMSALPAADQPAWVVCYLNRQEQPPSYDCAEVYGPRSR